VSSVDSRIVTMKFNNAQFEQGASQTISTLDKLKASLHLPGVEKGLNNVQAAIDKVNFKGMEGGISHISGAFIALGTVAVTALSNITTKAMEVGGTLAKQLGGIQAMQDGFSDYELKVGATGTIMAGTGENIGTVTKYLKDLDEYADKTIYNLSDMVTNLSKFTNAGVKLPVAVEAMKGIGNLAAVSGANSNQAAIAMYNLGQAIGDGALRLQNWNSVEIADMGTVEFKQQLIDTAVAMGTLKKAGDGTYKTLEGTRVTTKNFQTTLKDAWVTGEVLTKTLGRYADASTKIGKKSFKAAKDVKTFSMMMETLRASAGTGWTDTFETVIGTLPEATKLWTGMTNAIGGVIGASADARNKLLADWKTLGGRTDLIEGFKNIFEALGAIIKPIRDAFRDIFPRKTGQQLAEMTKTFRNFTEHLKIGKDTAENLKATFKGVFAIFSIVWTVIKGIASAFAALFGAIAKGVSGGGGGLLSLTAMIGNVASGFDRFLKRTDIINQVFGTIGKTIGTVIGYLIKLSKAVVSIFTGDENPFLDSMIAKFSALGPVIEGFRSNLQSFADTVSSIFSSIANAFGGGEKASASSTGLQAVNQSLEKTNTLIEIVKQTWADFVLGLQVIKGSTGSGISSIFTRLKDAFDNIGLQDVLSILNTIIFGGFIRELKKFFKAMRQGIGSVSGVLDAITDNLSAMQKEVKAKAIFKIALALLLLAAAVVVLSQIDPLDLAKGVAAVAIMLKLMTKALEELDAEIEKGSSKEAIAGGARLILMSTAIMILAASMIAMALALKLLGSIPTGELIKGMLTFVVVMAVMVGAAKAFEASGGAKSLLAASTSLLILSFALITLAGALVLWDQLDASTIMDSIWKVALVLGVLSAVMQTFPKKGQLVKAAVSILILGVALNILALALKQIDSISAGGLAKSIASIAAMLVILVAAVLLMNVAKAGAKNMVIVSGALVVLAMALKILSSIPWQGLLLALGAIAGVFVILGVAGLVLGPITPIILLLAAALGILGLAMLAIGVGFAAFAAGLVALAAIGTPALMALITLLPVVGAQLAYAVVAWVKIIGDSAPLIGDAIYKVIMSIINTVKKLLPEVPPLLLAMLDTFLKVMKEAVPKIARAALSWLLAMLKAIRDNIYQITTVVIEIILKFVDAVADNMKRIVDSATNLIVSFLNAIGNRENTKRIADAALNAITEFANGIMDAIEDPENQKKFKDTGKRMADMVVDGLIIGLRNFTVAGRLWSAGAWLIDKVKGGADEAADSASPSKEFQKRGMYIVQGLANGIDKYAYLAAEAGSGMVEDTLSSVKTTMSKISDAVSADIDMNPTIAPVLDLTQFRKDAAKMDSVIKAKSLTPRVSLGQATSISNERAQAQELVGAALQTPAPLIQFEQNNYSPKALSAIDIYRQTRNQLSLAKEALTA